VQRSDVGGQMSEGITPGHAADARLSELRSPIFDLRNRRRHRPGRCSRIGLRIPMPRPDLAPPQR